MDFVTIDEDELEDYLDILDPDIAESILRKYYRGIGCADDNLDPVGYVVYSLSHMEDDEPAAAMILRLYAKEDAEEGVLDGLLEEMFFALEEDGVERVRFELPEDADPRALDALKRAGFAVERKESDILIVTAKQALETPALSGAASKNVTEVARIDSRILRSGVMNYVFSGKSPLTEDLSTLPHTWFEPMISACGIQDGKVKSMFLLHRLPSGCIEVVLLYAVGQDYRSDLLGIMRFTVRKIRECIKPETKFLIARKTPQIRALTNALFPNIKGPDVYFGERDVRS